MVAALATAVLAGTIGGAVLAADNGEDGSPEAAHEALLDRVCAVYQEKTGVTIDREALKDAFEQAQGEMQTEAIKSWLDSLVEEGKITQDQADEYLEWQQTKPDVPFGSGLNGRGGSRGHGGLRGHGGFRGMGSCGGWGGTDTTTQ